MIHEKKKEQLVHTPIHIAKLCRYSSCIFLIPGTLNLYIGCPLNGCVLYLLVLTSQLHWRRPIYGSIYHKIDRATICANVIVSGVNVQTHLHPIHSVYYWCGMTTVLFMYLYSKHIRHNKNTRNRKYVSIIVHILGVHILAGLIGTTLCIVKTYIRET